MTVPLVVIVCAFEGLPTVAYAHQASYVLLFIQAKPVAPELNEAQFGED